MITEGLWAVGATPRTALASGDLCQSPQAPPRQMLRSGHRPLNPTGCGASLALPPAHLQAEERHGAPPGAEKGHGPSRCLEAWLIGGGSFPTYSPPLLSHSGP